MWTLARLAGAILLIYFSRLVDSLPSVLKIGALFLESERNSGSELLFKYAVWRINNDTELLPNTTLLYDIRYVDNRDSFHASRRACEQVENGVMAIFGPSDPTLSSHVQSICDALEIPHIETRLNLENHLKPFSINLHPPLNLINKAFEDVMQFLNWTTAAILYEEDSGLLKLQDLIKTTKPGSLQVILRQATAETYTEVLREIKSKEIYNIIVDAKTESMNALLKGVLQLQMNDYKYHYLFTTLDIESFNLEAFKYNFVNITAFRVVDSEHYKVMQLIKEMENSKFQSQQRITNDGSRNLRAESALIFDAVNVFAHGLQAFERGSSLRPANVSCHQEVPWSDGSSLYNYINSVEFRGLTGQLQFREGRRSSIKLDILKLKSHALVKVGEWNSLSGVNITDNMAFYDEGSMNVTLIVTTNLERPYVMLRHGKNYTGNNRFYGFCIDLIEEIAKHAKFSYIIELNPDGVYGVENPATGEWNGIVKQLMTHEVPYIMLRQDKNATGNERFEGFCVDLLKTIAEKVGFQYTIKLSAEGKYGIPHPVTGEWNGIVRELIERKADLAIGQMTINYARESVIDFTKPFMNLGISIMFKVPTRQPARLFSFMKPLTLDVWLYVLVAYVLVSITMFLVSHFSPYEWKNPFPCVTESSVVRNQFSIGNSFWFTIGTLMQQGSDLNPMAGSTRIVSGIWWFFTLIIISSYTANLAAFLTVERMAAPIESAQDLAEQSEISYGILESGTTMTFFRDSQIETYQKMWRYMENRKPSVLVSTYDEGVRRVLEGNYAFLMESTTLDYFIQRNCNLTQIGGLIDSKYYGIATPMGSPWRDRISLAILELQEKGVIQMFYNRWWKNTGEVCNRVEKGKETKANALGVDNIGGVFVVLLCGLAFAVLVAILEFCWNSKRNSSYEHSICSEMAHEFCFALRCGGSRQRPALKRKCSQCAANMSYVPSNIDLSLIPPTSNDYVGPYEDDWNDNRNEIITNV